MRWYSKTGLERKERHQDQPWQRALRLAVLSLLGLSLNACVTTREEVSDVRTSFSVDDGYWGGKDDTSKNADDSSEIRDRYASKGWTTDKDGKMTARNSDLYGGDSFGRGKNFETNEAKLSKREAETKYFDTPEYLERQGFATDSAREGKDRAGEGLFGSNRADESGRSADTRAKEGFLAGLNPFKTDSAKESGRGFETSVFREGARAQANAPYATGVSQGEVGYYTDSIRTLDDVKKILNPEAFD